MRANTTASILLIQQQISTLAKRQEETLTALARLAKGTADVTDAAQQATTAVTAEVSLESRLRAFLQERAHSLDELSERSGAKAGPLSEILKPWKQSRRVYNLGTEDRPRWLWVPGPEASTDDLRQTITTMIADRPMELQTMADVLGVVPNKVSTVLVKMTREGMPVTNVGNAKRARWFLLTEAPKRKG